MLAFLIIKEPKPGGAVRLPAFSVASRMHYPQSGGLKFAFANQSILSPITSWYRLGGGYEQDGKSKLRQKERRMDPGAM